MRFGIEGITIFFPFKKAYPEQLDYIKLLVI
jgi:hypothetical protein